MELRLPPLRTELVEGVALGDVGRLRRYELTPPTIPERTVVISSANEDPVGCAHARRASIIARLGGGHLTDTRDALLRNVLVGAAERFDASSAREADAQIRGVVSWLEREHAHGIFERAYTTMTIVLPIDDCEVWTWSVSPHGIWSGNAEAGSFQSTDLRYPVLRDLGARIGFAGDGLDPASSIACIGTPNGYETIRTSLETDDLLIAFSRSTLPFGPWPSAPAPIERHWEMDAAWKYGVRGRAVVVGGIALEALRLPPDWQIAEVPFEG